MEDHAIDLQRCRGSHGEALARMLGSPDAEILIQPLGYEPEFSPSNDASSVISSSESPNSNWTNCSPTARSLNPGTNQRGDLRIRKDSGMS